MNKKLSIEFPSVSEVELEHRPPYAGQGKENGNRGYVNLRDYSSAGLKDKNGEPMLGGLEYLHKAYGYNDNSTASNGDSYHRGYLTNHRPNNSRQLFGGAEGFFALLESSTQKELTEMGLKEWIQIKKDMAPSWEVKRQFVHKWDSEIKATSATRTRKESPKQAALRESVKSEVLSSLTVEELQAMISARESTEDIEFDIKESKK
jgi:hypothetical protein|tara:strand:+ start:754 stop:1368 length:615 start_codon:yes stop_codon:yes gene_type:complete